jgi:hypothetical protein
MLGKKAIDTHSEHVIIIDFPRQLFYTRTGLTVTFIRTSLVLFDVECTAIHFCDAVLRFTFIRTCGFTGNCSDFVDYLFGKAPVDWSIVV